MLSKSDQFHKNQSAEWTSRTGRLEERPLVSVVTVVLNSPKKLEKTIASVSGQRYGNVEHVVIDGGSEKETVDVIERHADVIDYWISERDDGIFFAMNKGLIASRGDYLIFVNAGDCFADDLVVEDVVDGYLKGGPDIVYGSLFADAGEYSKKPFSLRLKTEYDLYRQTICHQTIFTSRRAFIKVGLFDTSYKLCADREWLLRALTVHRLKLVQMERPVVVFDCSGVSSSKPRTVKLENLKMNFHYFGKQFYFMILKQATGKCMRFLKSKKIGSYDPLP